MLKIKRAYESPHPDDGIRVLVDRLWPRGLSKDTAEIQVWMKEIAPSHELRRWYGHLEERWPAFQERYEAELEEPEARGQMARLRDLCAEGPVTLVFGARETRRNNAGVLFELLTAPR